MNDKTKHGFISFPKSEGLDQSALLAHLISQNDAYAIQDFKDSWILHFYHNLNSILSGGHQMTFLHQRDMPRDIGLFSMNGLDDFVNRFFPSSQTLQDF